MLRIKISDMLGKHKMTQKELAEKTGIRPGTVSKMYYETIIRVDIKHLNRICQVLNCKIEDLLEYIPDEER